MTQSSYPFDGQTLSETDFSYLFRELQDTGVLRSPSSALQVSADASGMNVKVAAGSALVRGHFYRSTAVETLTIAPAAANPRIDTVVLRLDPLANSVVLAVLTGTPGASPAPLAPTQTDAAIYELPLGYVAVAASVVTIASGAVSDTRRRTGSRLGVWTTELRPASPHARQLGFNETTGAWESWSGAAWESLVSWATIPGKPTTSTLDGRTIFVSDIAPTSGQGANGDIWLEY